MDLGIRGRKAIVAGGSAGLGASCARALAADGVEVFVSARGEERLRQFVETTSRETGGVMHAVVADHGTEAGRAALLAACPEPDILVVSSSPAPLTDDYLKIDPQDHRDSLEINYIAPVELMRSTLEGMAARGFGRVVHIATAGAKSPMEVRLRSGPPRSALINFVHAISKRYIVNNVTVNNLLPGVFNTAATSEHFARLAARTGTTAEEIEFKTAEGFRVPAGRFGRMEEFGLFCATLCSANASFITGQSIVIDGGAVTTLI